MYNFIELKDINLILIYFYTSTFIYQYIYQQTISTPTGKIVDEHLTTIQSWPSKPHLVYGDWITESIKQKRPADEAQFAHLSDGSGCSSNSPKPPRRPPRVPVPSQQQENNETYVDEAIINQYLKPGAKLDDTRNVSLNETANMSALPDSQTTFVQGMFSGKTVKCV